MTGDALIDAGLRERDRELVGTGIRAVSFATDPQRRPGRPSVFEQLGVAGASNLARRRLADVRGFARARPRWERWLRRVRIVELQPRAAPAARRVLLQSVWTAAAMTAPNGSIAYVGRSQEEAWAPAGAAYGAPARRVARTHRGGRDRRRPVARAAGDAYCALR